jgi:transposase
LRLLLTPGQAHDLDGADALLPHMAADLLIADKAFDADKRVRERLATAGKAAVIPPMPNRRKPLDFDRELYKARHLVENFFCKLKTVPGHRHALRQDRHKFPRRHSPRRGYHLAQLTTRPRPPARIFSIFARGAF